MILLAVEGLTFESFSCDSNLSEPDKGAGFRTFCEEAVRFTHAYATSPLTAASMGSILTGLYPVEHGLRDNGSQFLSGDHKTVSEMALVEGYRTAFFSSGAPVLYKSGLGQGFEAFKDSVNLIQGEHYRPAETLMEEALEWFTESPRSRHFVVMYLGDLQFPRKTTTNTEGEIRSQTPKSQLAEIDESIGHFVAALKKQGRWDSSTVILAGLNGGLLEGEGREERGVSLYSENVQVKLLIKPQRKKRDKGLQWKVDESVSLADLGHTLFDLIGTDSNRISQFNTVSLKPTLSSLDQGVPTKRMIPIESSWAEWRSVGIPRLSVRMDQYLYIYDKGVRFYNTIYDRGERAQIDLKDPLALDSLAKIERFVKSSPYKKWRPLAPNFREKLLLSRKMFEGSTNGSELLRDLKHLSIHRSWDDQVWGWRAKLALMNEDWSDLLKVGEAQGQRAWKLVAESNLKDEPADLDLKGLEKCEVFLADLSFEPTPQTCEDEVFRALVDWARESDPFRSERKKENFLRKYRWVEVDRSVDAMNYSTGLNWATNIAGFSQPSFTELAFALPKFQGLRRQVEARLSKSNELR